MTTTLPGWLIIRSLTIDPLAPTSGKRHVTRCTHPKCPTRYYAEHDTREQAHRAAEVHLTSEHGIESTS